MKEIDIVCATYLNLPNGLSKFLVNLINNNDKFIRKGYQLNVLTLDCFKSLPKSAKVLQRRANIKNLVLKLIPYSHLLTYIVLYKTILTHAKEMAGYYIPSEKSNFVVFQDMFSCYYYLCSKPNKHQKILLTMHNKGDMWNMLASTYPLINSPLFFFFRKRIENVILNRCDAIGFVSETSKNYFNKKYNSYNEENTYFIHNGIDCLPLERHFTKKDVVNFVCVATLNSRKNQIGILNAVNQLPANEKNRIVITLVGDGPDYDLLKKYSITNNLNVNFTGSVNNVKDYLDDADIFVLFAKEEGLPISIIEAMRSGLPIIATNVDGIPEEVETNVNGYLVNVNVNELSKAISDIMNHSEMIERMGRMSYKIFEKKFTTEVMVYSYAQLFKKYLTNDILE